MTEIDQVYTHELRFTQEILNSFAKVTGGENPVHLDVGYEAL